MAEYEAHRPNYAELNKAHEEALQRQPEQQEAEREPTRPEIVNRSVGGSDRGDIFSQQMKEIERNNVINHDWKQLQKNPELAQQVQQEREQQQAAQRGNEGPEHDHTGGRER